MVRKVVVILSVLALAVIAGCTGTAPGKSQPALGNVSISRKATLGSKWDMSQISVDVQPAADVQLLVRTSDGDKVDGYFYTPNGENIGFTVSGNSTVYQTAADASGKTGSDRFSFTATKDQGNTYALDFKNNSGQKINVFMELIVPTGDSLFIPLAIK